MKAKLTRTFTIAVLLAGLFISSSYGQTFAIESFDGSKQLVEVSPLSERGILAIKCAKDAVYIKDVNKLDTVRLLNKNFLLISYHLRAGSNIEAAKTLLLSTINNKLVESLQIISSFKEEFLDFSKPLTFESLKSHDKTAHHVNLYLTGESSANYNIKAIIHDESKSIDKPNTNYNNDTVVNLNFDRGQKIFYSSQEEIAPYFVRAYAKLNHSDEHIISGVFPIAKLGRYHSYYKAGKWYDLPDAPE